MTVEVLVALGACFVLLNLFVENSFREGLWSMLLGLKRIRADIRSLESSLYDLRRESLAEKEMLRARCRELEKKLDKGEST